MMNPLLSCRFITYYEKGNYSMLYTLYIKESNVFI